MREAIRDKGRLEHIHNAIMTIVDYVQDKTKAQIFSDVMVYHGIVKYIEIIGEASYMLTKDFRQNHSDTPWEIITKMRHVLVHDYYQISQEEVWNVILYDLPLLKTQIEQYLQEFDEK